MRIGYERIFEVFVSNLQFAEKEELLLKKKTNQITITSNLNLGEEILKS